ncbi:P-loop containing nucleoside triphosphate hydrolase protein [Parachaetomium inaequale]|uniref:P-loop containing nucleoside triphosphate hydrolase protein n=1 Tax=Parachaetomium inaequale TaxID=2588326 RepID=A0AAN6PIQ4_9PEZI|nr:P-loop containing nucleoside triphosphate hydrolase protein [Parachaetomium inaequale]
MSPTEHRHHIAAGCLVLDKTAARLPDELWSLVEPAQWHHFGPFGYLDGEDGVEGQNGHDPPTQNGPSHCRFLGQKVQDHLISSSGCLASYAALLRNGWIDMSLSLSLDHSEQLIVRVYLLPDDVENRTIPRGDPSLRRARLSLLAQLDFSESTWRGQASGDPSPSPSLFINSETPIDARDGEGQSLLQMFNSIPSPDPSPHDIQDYDARDAAYRLMSSDVPGLSTTLYAYQRRSATLMLQRESQSQQVLDPRLVQVADQLGRSWYYDSVTGTSLREPRLYDGPCGGILAEEMGAGKTLICLALILATRHIPSAAPDHLRTDDPVTRRSVGSLADMAAACITRHSVPWKTVFGALEPDGIDHPLCVDAIRRNPAFYHLPRPVRRRESRQPATLPPPTKVYLSHSSLVIVPANLVQQWKQEIAKHTLGLEVLVVDKKRELPPVEELVEYDIILFSSTRFERLWDDIGSDRSGAQVLRNPLATIHFKRCIVDEGHKLGNSTLGRKSNMHLIIDHLQISARWVVTGTPSKGLFGVDDSPSPTPDGGQRQSNRRQAKSSSDLEKDDLRRIGSIATLYLRMRPWANQWTEGGDSPADWAVYVMQPRHSARSTGRADCLKATLESLIIRHRLSEVGDLLPSVDEKIVYLDGSFQDRLVLNLFSMMIIFNAVQSQRTDQDYFFHPRQRKALLELVHNLRQASFFGGSFFSPDQIRKAIDTAENFLKDGKVQISSEDEALLRDAIELGRLAESNDIKRCANLFREVPLYVQNFPWGAGREWSLDLKEGDPVCTDSRMVSALQKFLHPLVDAPTSLRVMFDTGRFAARGWEERSKGIEEQDPETEGNSRPRGLAGNTQLGQDNSSPTKRRSAILTKGLPKSEETPVPAEDHGTGIAAPLAETQLVSTASAKLSYLIDQIVQYQETEQIIIFYENDNVAYYLAGVLEILQVQHLIYAKGLTPERRAQYVATFNHNPKFRVLLMDMTQAAFGLDLQSASRVYFLSPVLNPQAEAQAIGRARRIGQARPAVAVETLVLRGSVEEVIVRRRAEMTQAEMWKCRSILDDKPIYEWILRAGILPLTGEGEEVPSGEGQMARLRTPLFVFGRGFGRALSHPDQDLVGVNGSPPVGGKRNGVVVPEGGRKRRSPAGEGTPVADGGGGGDAAPKKKARVRFAESGDEGGG